MEIIEAVAALAAVLTLIWLSARAMRMTKFTRTNAGATRSMAIKEVLAIDSQRRLVLVKCEDRLALLMIGGRHDMLVGWVGEKDLPI